MTTNEMTFQIQAAGISDTGLVRQTNEDAWEECAEINLFILADGMGGHQAGEVAAKEAVSTLCKIAKKMKKKMNLYETRDFFEHAIKNVNTVVYQLSKSQPGLRGMGTTLCCLQIRNEGIVYGHVGDSRIYRFRNDSLEQLTTDHSLMRELMDLGQLSESQASDFMYKNILTKAIGTEPLVEPSVYTEEFQVGDLFLLCSDGLSDPVSDSEIELILKNHSNIQEALKNLVEQANMKGGYDNITALIVKIEKKNV